MLIYKSSNTNNINYEDSNYGIYLSNSNDNSNIIMIKCLLIISLTLVLCELLSFVVIYLLKEKLYNDYYKDIMNLDVTKKVHEIQVFFDYLEVFQVFITILLFSASIFFISNIFIYYFDIHMFENLSFSIFIISFIMIFIIIKLNQIFYINHCGTNSLISTNIFSYFKINKFFNMNITQKEMNIFFTNFSNIIFKFTLIGIYTIILAYFAFVVNVYSYNISYLWILNIFIFFILLPILSLYFLNILNTNSINNENSLFNKIASYFIFYHEKISDYTEDENIKHILRAFMLLFYYMSIFFIISSPFLYEKYFSDFN